MGNHIDTTEIHKLYRNIGKLITSSIDMDEVIDKVMNEVESYFKPENWSMLRLDPVENELFFVVVEGIDADKVEGIRLKVGEGIAGHVAKTGETIYVADATKDERFSKKVDDVSGFQTKSLIAVPMCFKGQVLGVIEVINNTKPFAEEEVFVLETIADFAAIALANASIYQQVITTAHYDGLTGIYNRAKLDEYIEIWQSNPLARKDDSDHHDMCVFLIDLNDFKEVNDTEGHRAGDKLLRLAAQHIAKCSRNEDLVFRIGGDEFLLVLTHLEPDDATAMPKVMAERLEQASHELDSRGRFSYGFASGGQQDIVELMEGADAAMYEYKKARRERLGIKSER